MGDFTREQVQKAIELKDYSWFEGGDYNLNIVGIRNSSTEGKVTNKFDDWVTLSYSVNGELKYEEFKATTDPGSHWERNLMNKDGVAILVPGQYRSSHTIGLHQGKYEALRQKSPLKVYRDNNKDGVYNFSEESIKEGIYGINIHRATSTEGGKSTQIDKWSAGCQVIAANADFKLFMELVNKAAKLYGNSFTYTLVESNDIV
tara:strand:+ start:948 stop:1556 length:609 start_codon:yes stop_codon:yes gene_type:complete